MTITICLTYFRSLTLANLAASLYSVRQQDFSRVKEIVIVDNKTEDSGHEVRTTANAFAFPVPVRVLSFKHGDPTKTHSWSTNRAVREVTTPWVLFTRADYLLDPDAVTRLTEAATSDNRFIVSRYYDVGINIHRCEQTSWRQNGPTVLRSYGHEWDHTLIDSGVWMTRKDIFDSVVGLDETLTAWGHAQTVFQYRVYQAGVEFVKVPYVLFYHPAHDYVAPRDHSLALQQIGSAGLNLKEMWARYDGVGNPY